ncbi:MAG: helix-turn-helix domain-containing protein [Clostridiales bacterium]|nr:helix-turn-helix domain-containing protein [Clostridiales bacterium]
MRDRACYGRVPVLRHGKYQANPFLRRRYFYQFKGHARHPEHPPDVIETRLRKAAALLRATNQSAKDIALDCGFGDASYFTKMFRLKYHCTPGNYRKLS